MVNFDFNWVKMAGDGAQSETNNEWSTVSGFGEAWSSWSPPAALQRDVRNKHQTAVQTNKQTNSGKTTRVALLIDSASGACRERATKHC